MMRNDFQKLPGMIFSQWFSRPWSIMEYLLIILFFLLVIFYAVILFSGGSVAADFGGHVQILNKFLEHDRFPIPPGYPALVWVFSMGATQGYFTFATLLLMSVFTWLRIVVVKYLLDRHVGENRVGEMNINLLLAIAFSVAAPLWTGGATFYLGRFAWNIWHNPTYIMMIPAALLLFGMSAAFSRQPLRHTLYILILVMINLLVKPSFLFAWVPGMFFYLLWKERKINLRLLRVTAILGVSGLAILGMYFWIYSVGGIDELLADGPENGIGISFLSVWKFFLQNSNTRMGVALVSSMIFPACFFLFYGGSPRITRMTYISIWLMIPGLFFALFMVETGSRFYHGNFFWTAYSTTFMLQLACVINLLQMQRRERWQSTRSRVLAGIFALHTISGLMYMTSMMIRGSFY
jgi:hypothetical protein